MRGSKYFAKINAKRGFFQLTLAEESRYVTTFITSRGCYRFKWTPFGLSDASEAFQKMMDKILFGIEGVRISVDDVIIYAETMTELLRRIRKVLDRCRQYNLKLNRSKCEFGVQQITILGHVVSERGIEPDVAKTEAIKATPPPSNVSDLRSFLGTCGYVSKFIPSYANIVEPLRKLTRNGQKWTWEKEQAKAFKALKEALSGAPVLACFSLNAPTYVITDASPVGLGAILLQDQVNGERKPITYISRSLTSTERRYSQIEREALGCVWAVERLHNYLFGIKFTLLTNNKPLSSTFDPYSSKVLPPRIQRLVGGYISTVFVFSILQGTPTQQIRCRDCHPSKMIVQIPVSSAKIMYDLFTCQICQIFKRSLFLTWDEKLAKTSRCPNYLPKFKTENGHAILILNRIAA